MAKFLLSACVVHHDCTQKTTFASEGFDPSTDVRPISAKLQVLAEENFGPVACIDIQHLPGSIDIRREE